MRPLVRVAIVVAVASLQIGFALPDLVRPFQPLGDFGFSPFTNTVIRVLPGGPAARSQIAIGDTITFSRDARLRSYDPSGTSIVATHPRDALSISATHGEHRRQVTLIADTFNQYPSWFAVMRVLLETFWVLLAAFLVLRLPTTLTWSFFVFSAFPDISPMALAPLVFPVPLVALHHVVFEVFSAAAKPAAIAFILCLGGRPPPRWHAVAAMVFIPLFAVLSLPALIQNFLWYFWAIPHSIFDFGATRAYGLMSAVWGLVAIVLLGAIYSENQGKERARILWILVGFTIYALANTAIAVLPPSTPLGVRAVLWTTYGVLPICVTYAILKHRLVDINFFVSRALVYTAISGCLIALLGLIDWFFGKKLSDQRLSVYVQVVASIAFGFWFSNVHHHLEHFVNGVFFRRKHRAEQHLRQLAKALPYATSHTTINLGLVDEPVAAFELASAALYEKRGSTFQRMYMRGLPEASPSDLDSDNIASLDLRIDSDASVIDESWLKKYGLQSGPAKPDVALPVFVSGDLVAIALYGAHTRGDHLDEDELRTLTDLAVSAATGYAHLYATKLRHTCDSAKREAEAAMIQTELLRRENSVLRNAWGRAT